MGNISIKKNKYKILKKKTPDTNVTLTTNDNVSYDLINFSNSVDPEPPNYILNSVQYNLNSIQYNENKYGNTYQYNEQTYQATCHPVDNTSNLGYQNTYQQNTCENTYQQNTYQNTCQQNTYQDGNYNENSYQQNTYQVSNYNENTENMQNIGNYDEIYKLNCVNLQKIHIFNIQFISLWLNIYDNNKNISTVLIYDFNTYFLQNKQLPFPSNKYFNIVTDQNINNFLYTLILYYTDAYNLQTKINNHSNIKTVIIFIQELIMIFLDKNYLSIGILGSINLSEMRVINYILYKKLDIYDVYNDEIFSSKNQFIKNTNIKTIFGTSMILTNDYKLNIGITNAPINNNPEIITMPLSLFYRFITIYAFIQ